MNVPACRTPLALSFVFVLVCLGLPVLLLRGGSSVNAQIEKGAFTVKNFSLSPPGEREEPQPNQTVRNSTASPTQPTTDLIIDDGTFEAAVGISGGGTAIGVNRLTPASYPATLTAVLVFFQGQQGRRPRRRSRSWPGQILPAAPASATSHSRRSARLWKPRTASGFIRSRP